MSASCWSTNRTFGRALALAAGLGAEAVPFDRMKEMIRTSDLVISATSAPHYILRRDDLEEVMARRTKGTLLMIDIANPGTSPRTSARSPAWSCGTSKPSRRPPPSILRLGKLARWSGDKRVHLV